jgi:hypothetical protein
MRVACWSGRSVGTSLCPFRRNASAARSRANGPRANALSTPLCSATQQQSIHRHLAFLHFGSQGVPMVCGLYGLRKRKGRICPTGLRTMVGDPKHFGRINARGSRRGTQSPAGLPKVRPRRMLRATLPGHPRSHRGEPAPTGEPPQSPKGRVRDVGSLAPDEASEGRAAPCLERQVLY